MSKLVRIVPFNPRIGHVKQRHTIMKPRPMRFDASRGWYEVEDEIAEALRDIPQEERRPGGASAFMIADNAEHARQLEEALRRAARGQEPEAVGTLEAPIRVSRPGRKAPAAAAPAAKSEEPKPRTRTRTRSTVAVEDDGEGEIGGED